MTVYQYTVNPPYMDVDENIRTGYRTPRSILLPPYLAVNSFYSEYTDAIDSVFETNVDIKTEIVAGLRNMWVTSPGLENNEIANSQLIEYDSWAQPERSLLVSQVNALGMKLQNAGVISNDSYQAIARWVGMYWFGKGTESFIEFINYSLSSFLTVTPMWTQDYVNFVPAGSSLIGTPIWEGGTWYPTTTVEIIANGGLGTLDINTLVSFFYEIANYNLVLYAVDINFEMPITDDPALIRTDAEIVAIGLWEDVPVMIANANN
jgi:hypothetical protein